MLPGRFASRRRKRTLTYSPVASLQMTIYSAVWTAAQATTPCTFETLVRTRRTLLKAGGCLFRLPARRTRSCHPGQPNLRYDGRSETPQALDLAPAYRMTRVSSLSEE